MLSTFVIANFPATGVLVSSLLWPWRLHIQEIVGFVVLGVGKRFVDIQTNDTTKWSCERAHSACRFSTFRWSDWVDQSRSAFYKVPHQTKDASLLNSYTFHQTSHIMIEYGTNSTSMKKQQKCETGRLLEIFLTTLTTCYVTTWEIHHHIFHCHCPTILITTIT